MCAGTVSCRIAASTSFAVNRIKPESEMSPRLSGRLLRVSSMHDFHSRRLETLQLPILRPSLSICIKALKCLKAIRATTPRAEPGPGGATLEPGRTTLPGRGVCVARWGTAESHGGPNHHREQAPAAAAFGGTRKRRSRRRHAGRAPAAWALTWAWTARCPSRRPDWATPAEYRSRWLVRTCSHADRHIQSRSRNDASSTPDAAC